MIRKIAAAGARLVPNYMLTWRDSPACWAQEPVRRSSEAPGRLILAAGRTTTFNFIAPAPALDRLTLEFARQPWPASALTLELADAAGGVLGRWSTAARTIRAGGVVPVADFHGLRFEPGARYTVKLSASGQPISSVTLRASKDRGRGAASRSRILGFTAERTRSPPMPPGPGARHVAVFPPGVARRADLELLSQAFPHAAFASVVMDGLDSVWPAVANAEVVVFAGAPVPDGQRAGFDQLCFELHRRGVCTLALDSDAVTPWPLAGGAVDQDRRRAEADRRRCRFILRRGQPPTLARSQGPDEAWTEAPRLGRSDSLRKLADAARADAGPQVCVVMLADGPAEGLAEALKRLQSQSWPDIRVLVAVAEGRETDRRAAAEAIEAVFGHVGDDRAKLVLGAADPVERFLGATEAESAGIRLLLDGPWLVNRDFVAAHMFEHLDPSVRAVVGPPPVRPGPGEHEGLVAALESDPEALRALAAGDDPVQLDSFVNLARAPFSLKRGPPPAFAPGDAPPEPEPGWRRIALGYQLYLDGGRIQYTNRALALAAVAEPALPDTALPPSGAAWLAEQHEDFPLTARRWLTSIGVPPSGAVPSAPFVARRPARALRVLSYRWHVPHQYELYKLPHQFTLATDAGENGMTNHWDFEQRPLRPNVRFAPAAQIDPAEFDVAIAHFDENVLAPELCNGVVPLAWGDPFRWLMSLPLPKVAICHGTPQFVGQYGLDPNPIHRFELHEAERARLVAFTKEALVVCNSHQAEAEWGFARSQVIWHGFDPNEFPPGKGDLDVLALGGDWKRPHYRGAWEELDVRARLHPDIRVETAHHAGGAGEIRNGNPYAVARFHGYAARIGRFKTYLNTTLRSPMPRSRGEAMMTGAAPVCLDNHDVSLFIENGVNGFYSKDSAELADFLNHVCRNEASARRISAAARRTALDVFNHDRYLAAWTELLERTAG